MFKVALFTIAKTWCVNYSVMSDFVTPWTIAHQAPLSMEFSRQEYWSGLPFPSQRDLPDPGIEPGSPALQADSLPSEPLGMSKLLKPETWKQAKCPSTDEWIKKT